MLDSDANMIKCFKTCGGTLVELDDNNGEEIITVHSSADDYLHLY